MAKVSLSISDIFQLGFGRSSAFEPEIAAMPAKQTEGKAAGSPYYSPGREYYLPVEIQVSNEQIPGENSTYAERLGATNRDGSTTGGRWLLPYPVISFFNTKTIVDTPLTERNGVVSELINTGGWLIRIRGFMKGANNEFPEDDFAILTRLYEMSIPIRIKNVMTDIILLNTGSDEVVIRRLDFPPSQGVQGVKYYEMELTSNVPFSLEEITN